MAYDPPRRLAPAPTNDPLEIELVYNVRPCGTCSFFWPDDPANQPYGPFPAYDFESNAPKEQPPAGTIAAFKWIKGRTRPETFPDAEVVDGCRKAPIMTIGINPNLTAFGTNTTGTSWCYPSFSSAEGSDSYAKYAYYYRYRSIYQERFDLAFVKKYLRPDGQIKAAKAGVMQPTPRATDAPAFDLQVLYDEDQENTAIHLPGKLGQPRYVVLVDPYGRFAAGDLLAATLDVPAGDETDIFAQPITYYQQMLPVLAAFNRFLKQKGHDDANVRVGEDVSQLDMVACASPHWGPPWLGGTTQSVGKIISNCVHKNAWALKQLLQSRPAVLFLVGQASWNMFNHAFGRYVQASPALPKYPEDGPYTLMRVCAAQPCQFKFSTRIDGLDYSISTRLVIVPHFSFSDNFLPQFRLAPAALQQFGTDYPEVAAFLRTDPRLKTFVQAGSFTGIGILRDRAAVLAAIEQKSASAYAQLTAAFYDPHATMADILAEMYGTGELGYTAAADQQPGYVSRGAGPCSFCDNPHWKFPEGCPYGKPAETPYPPGFLNRVAAAIVAGNSGAH